MHHAEVLLQLAAGAAKSAADACRAWEDGDDADAVADTAWEAEEAISEALRAVAGIDPALAAPIYPETRLGRLVMAARPLVLAGTDEEGQSEELGIAARVFTLAAEAA